MTQTAVPSVRLASLDAFRGLTIVGMLWVNNQVASVSLGRQWGHAAWGEFPTFTDMIFPWFLFIVGVAMPFSRAAFFGRGGKTTTFFLKALRRAVTLFLLGCLIDSSVGRRMSVGMGVLQLIGWSYFVAAFANELRVKARAALAAAMLVGYWAFLRYFDVPGIGRGVFEEGRTAADYIHVTYLAKWGLKGILSVIPASALVLIGTLMGDLLRTERETGPNKVRWLLFAGGMLALVGLGWHLDLPMNKPVWTPSYIVFGGGMGCIVLALFYWTMDLRGWRRWAFFFTVYGMNAIAAYVVSILVREHTVKEWVTTTAAGAKSTVWKDLIAGAERLMGPAAGGAVFTAGYIFLWWLVMLWMHRRKMYWKV